VDVSTSSAPVAIAFAGWRASCFGMTTSVAAAPPPATVPPVPIVPAPVPGVSPRGIVDGVTVAVGAALALASAYRLLMILFLKDEPPHVELVYTLLVGLAAIVWPSRRSSTTSSS
jgi:hypothetical protein